jgi:hypothetical protein
MHTPDPELSRLLQQWKAPEPSPTFDADVLRRIRIRQPPLRGGWMGWLQPSPALTAAAALILAVVLAHQTSTVRPAAGILAQDSLAHHYTQLAKGNP